MQNKLYLTSLGRKLAVTNFMLESHRRHFENMGLPLQAQYAGCNTLF